MRNGCDHCDYKVLTKTVLNRHKLSDAIIKFGLKLFSINTNCPSMRNGCDHCDYKVLTKTVLNRHKLSEHEKWM